MLSSALNGWTLGFSRRTEFIPLYLFFSRRTEFIPLYLFFEFINLYHIRITE